ncbi:MAG: hypothetical protein K2H96_08845 [Muribaculaceae bacterium]|nr:hypothetical protein [Muribaculaceae bacterium]
MIKFDKIKLITSINYINHINTERFIAVTKYDAVLYYKYHQESPYSLLIMIDYEHNELVLEFTGKILFDNYPNLICSETIEVCLRNINRLGICILNINAILQDAEVVKCDVTKDIECDLKTLTSTIRQNITNYSKWNVKGYGNGIVIENVVATPKYKKRLVIYDKGKELRKANNINFINSLENSRDVIGYYENKIRFELNINTKYQIRQLLNVPSNNLTSVLNSKANPILSIIDEAVKYESPLIKKQSVRDYERELLLKDCDFDMVRVEAKLRSLSSKNTSIKRLMQPYKDLYKRINLINSPSFDVRSLVV